LKWFVELSEKLLLQPFKKTRFNQRTKPKKKEAAKENKSTSYSSNAKQAIPFLWYAMALVGSLAIAVEASPTASNQIL